MGIATTLSKCAGLEYESYPSELSLRAEARRRVFWSLHLLQQVYGQHGSSTTILQDIANPQYVAMQPDLRKRLDSLPPSMPQETVHGGMSQKSGIWAYMIQLSTLWREVRSYVMQWAQTNGEPPWSVESGYAVIGAHLMDLETKLPTSHRFDSARFPDQDNEQLQRNRGYWSPWLYLQFTYHAIHSMLNHPFLYSSRPQQSAQLAVPNTFWKTSSELAFIHATWIARLIDMISAKAYRISDPFIGHSTAIAATIHIYFCRAADTRIREAAQVKLATCVAFLGELAQLWPSCRLMVRFDFPRERHYLGCLVLRQVVIELTFHKHEKLQVLVQSAFTFDQPSGDHESPRKTISINRRMMWKILQYNIAGKGHPLPGYSLFDESFLREDEEDDTDQGEDTVETQIFHNPTTDVEMSNGQALPPYSGQPSNSQDFQDGSSRGGRGGGGGSRRDQQQQLSSSVPTSMAVDHPPLPDVAAAGSAAASWPLPGNPPVMDMTYDPFFQFQDPGSPFFGTWEVGNL